MISHLTSLFSTTLSIMENRSSGLQYSLAGTAAVTVGSLLWGYHLYLSQQRAGEAPIVWSWIPVFGSAIEFGQKPIELMIKLSKKSEEIFGLLLAGIIIMSRWLSVISAESIYALSNKSIINIK